jgi:hypothetical protein
MSGSKMGNITGLTKEEKEEGDAAQEKLKAEQVMRKTAFL